MFGAPKQISTGFASWLRYCTASEQCAPAKLCGVEQRAPAIFGRAAITFSIGPHSNFVHCKNKTADDNHFNVSQKKNLAKKKRCHGDSFVRFQRTPATLPLTTTYRHRRNISGRLKTSPTPRQLISHDGATQPRFDLRRRKRLAKITTIRLQQLSGGTLRRSHERHCPGRCGC